MPKVSAGYLDARRQEILEAALRCFARTGFHETTIEDIAREAGVSHGAIYRYFRSKGRIIEAVSRRDREGRARRFEEAQRDAAPIEALDRILGDYVARLSGPGGEQERRLRTQLLSEAARNPRANETIRGVWSDVIERLAVIVRRGQAEGEIDPGLDAATVARIIAVIHDGLIVHTAVDPEVDIEGCMRVVRAFLRGGLSPAAARAPERVRPGDRS
jgi:AcrR family transcriptional regulator